MTLVLRPEPLTAAAFAPFGDVVEAGSAPLTINQGFAQRFSDLAQIDVTAEGGAISISLFHGEPQAAPVSLKLVERHPLGSQLFYPLQDVAWIAIVAEAPEPGALRAFRTSGRQGVNFARNVWHHPLLAPVAGSRFLIIDRLGPGSNLEEHWFGEDERPVLEG
ncbi:ureidoglycolate lyase [soil metagenome]